MSILAKPSEVSDLQLSRWMREVLKEARTGVARGENPFGAGVFRPDGSRVAAECNQTKSTVNPSAHAEVCAIASACSTIDKQSLEGYWLLATAEPCPMCMSAAAIAGIRHVAFGASQAVVTEAGYGSLGMTGREILDHFAPSMHVDIRGPIRGNECVELLLRNRKKS